MVYISLNSFSWTSLPSTKVLKDAHNPLLIFKVSKLIIRACSSSSGEAIPDPKIANFSGCKLEETVNVISTKLRLDSWISSQINGISRARVQSSIRSGVVSVNGRVIDKASYMVRGGDKVDCTISVLQPLRAEPEDIPLDIVFEDEHVLVVNKPPPMVRVLKGINTTFFP